MGTAFQSVEDTYFGRGALKIDTSLQAWSIAWASLTGGNSQQAAYYTIEFGTIALAAMACVFTLKRYPAAALFGMVILLISSTSNSPQSMAHYILTVPSLFIFLSRLGKQPWFDRAWTIASVLLMGVETMLFTFDMWVA